MVYSFHIRRENMSSYQAFIFDMDGTIVDTLEDMIDAVNVGLKAYSLPSITYEEGSTFVGNGSVKLIQRAMKGKKTELFTQVFDTYYQCYMSHPCVKTKPYPHLLDALALAKKKGILLFIYTNKPEKIAEEVKDTCFPKDTFAKMVGIPLGGKTKPDPVAFFEATKEYHLDYQRVAYFGDSTTDILTAHNLGTPHMFSVLWGYQSKEKILTAPYAPEAFLTDPKEIENIALSSLS